MISNAKTCDWIFPVTRVSSIKIPVDDTKKLTTAEYRMEIYEDMRKRRQDILRELRARKTGKGKGKAKGKAKGGSKEPGPFTLYGLAYCPYTGTHGRVCLRVSALSC